MLSLGGLGAYVLLIGPMLLGQTALETKPFNPEVQREASLPLNGQWERLLEQRDKEVWKAEVAEGLEGWRKVRVPGNVLVGLKPPQWQSVNCVWVRRSFQLTAEQAGRGAVLRWDGIRFGPTVWTNGRRVAHHPPMGPATVMLPPGTLRQGRNQIVLKLWGWKGIPRGKAGYPLIPVGSGTQRWGAKNACIEDDIWLDFHGGLYVRAALAIPNVREGKVTFRVHLDAAGEWPSDVELSASVRPWRKHQPVDRGRTALRGKKRVLNLPVTLTNPKLWTPQERNLYEAALELRAGGKLLDELRFRFGLRELKVYGGHYQLNGKPFWFRGSNLVCEWRWGGYDGIFNRKVKSYIVDEARAMNLNCFRTHTLPPPKRWADTGDEHGTMFWAELPVLYNYANFRFTPEEREIFHRHALLDATGWVSKLWNHPSVGLWVLSNESRDDNEWEKTTFYGHVRKLDPTRPSLRSGGPEGTPDVVDVHTCNNYGHLTEGAELPVYARHAAGKDPKRALSNSEYMNYLKAREEYPLKWLGRKDHPGEPLVFAEFAMEHTEAMRRLRYDGILPYMYAGWTALRRGDRIWRKDFPSPMAAALHSSMSPVLVSLDLFDRNFAAGNTVETPLAMINDTLEDAPATVEVYLTPKDPLFVPDPAALKAAVHRDRFEHTFAANCVTSRKLQWPVPKTEGSYYLAVVVTREGRRPVVSQRVVRAIDPAASERGLQRVPVVALGVSQAGQTWMKRRKISFRTSLDEKLSRGDVVVIWDASAIPAAERKAAGERILRLVRGGGRCVILNQRKWDWPELIDLRMRARPCSRAFAYPKAKHPMLAGIAREHLMRWNGVPGTVADRSLTWQESVKAEKLLWMERPEYTIAARAPVGSGEIVVCLLMLKSHLPGSGRYDPVAERILLNLLARGSSPSTRPG